jgi:hypothetical protein
MAGVESGCYKMQVTLRKKLIFNIASAIVLEKRVSHRCCRRALQNNFRGFFLPEIMDRKFNKCDTCKEWHWTNEPCLPEFKVFHEDHLGDDHKAVRAIDGEEAALAYAAYYNTSCGYCLMNEEIEIFVEEDGEKVKYLIGADPGISYSATRK